MKELPISADNLVSKLLSLSRSEPVCILDSCGVGHLGSHLLIAGIRPVEALEITNENVVATLRLLDDKLSLPNLAAIVTISYDFGLKLQNLKPRAKAFPSFREPDVFLAIFDSLIVHDYNTGGTFITGNEASFSLIEELLARPAGGQAIPIGEPAALTSNFSRGDYLTAIESIKEAIRRGDTYQTNLTQQIRVQLPAGVTPEEIFSRLRRDNPAPFAAFLKRTDSTVVSASPERFIKIKSQEENGETLHISTSPIKGTRPRGETPESDLRLRNELAASEKDRAENVMIVDLLRNDLGRVCKFGSVAVETLCELEEHPTLFHLVSTISGELNSDLRFSDILNAVFPCGSITGAPKIRTMQIIDELETASRGLSMGAIGISIPTSGFDISNSCLDMSVAIRTMVVGGGEAVFNVGGGIVIDSDPESEFQESLLKAKALIAAIGAKPLEK